MDINILRGWFVLQFLLTKKCNPILPKALAQNTCTALLSIVGTNSRPIFQESVRVMESIGVDWDGHDIPLAICSAAM